jgi:hypothetical protein
MNGITTNFECTDRALRVIRAAQAEGSTFSSPHLIPLVGDEIEFPAMTGRVVFTVVKRRLHMSEGPPTITVWLDAPEDAAGPVDSVA